MSFRSHKAQLRIRNLTGYDTYQLRRIIRLASPWCAQPNSFLTGPTDITFRPLQVETMGKDVVWPRVDPTRSGRRYVEVDLPPFLCPTISLLRCIHWLGSSTWFSPPETLDYWREIEAKVGAMLVSPTLAPKRKARR